jgi:hypothetical protein
MRTDPPSPRSSLRRRVSNRRLNPDLGPVPASMTQMAVALPTARRETMPLQARRPPTSGPVASRPCARPTTPPIRGWVAPARTSRRPTASTRGRAPARYEQDQRVDREYPKRTVADISAPTAGAPLDDGGRELDRGTPRRRMDRLERQGWRDSPRRLLSRRRRHLRIALRSLALIRFHQCSRPS